MKDLTTKTKDNTNLFNKENKNLFEDSNHIENSIKNNGTINSDFLNNNNIKAKENIINEDLNKIKNNQNNKNNNFSPLNNPEGKNNNLNNKEKEIKENENIKEKININTIQNFNNEIQYIRKQIKEKSENIINTINTINQITKKKNPINENYKKALLLAINSGFFKPRKMYNFYKSSHYLYKNIKKEIMLKKYLDKMEKELIKLNYFILQHVSKKYSI